MNRGLNLPQIQRIMNEFEKESATMDMKDEMMSDAVDDVMDEGLEDEEEEGFASRLGFARACWRSCLDEMECDEAPCSFAGV